MLKIPGTLTEHVDESALARAAAKQQLLYAVDTYGVETVTRWLRHVAHDHGYTLTVTAKEPGTIGDPRR